MIAAILRAQLLSMRFGARNRRTGSIFSVIASAIFYGLWTFFALAVMMFFATPENAPTFTAALSGGLLFVVAYWQLAPVLSASFGASLDLRKLLPYPIPIVQLFTVEVLLRVLTCAEMLILLTGATLGLLRNPLYGARGVALHRFGSGRLCRLQYPFFRRRPPYAGAAVQTHPHERSDGSADCRRQPRPADSPLHERAQGYAASLRPLADRMALGCRRAPDAARSPRMERHRRHRLAGDRLCIRPLAIRTSHPLRRSQPEKNRAQYELCLAWPREPPHSWCAFCPIPAIRAPRSFEKELRTFVRVPASIASLTLCPASSGSCFTFSSPTQGGAAFWFPWRDALPFDGALWPC